MVFEFLIAFLAGALVCALCLMPIVVRQRRKIARLNWQPPEGKSVNDLLYGRLLKRPPGK
ncbi:MAG: LapA family protein [Proteobacteria bacterium]|nr:LapA family protein [Pseudomonadota bacterium]